MTLLLELLAGAFVIVGVLAVVVRFAPHLVSGRAPLPRVIDQSIGMWVVRRIRGRVSPRSAAEQRPVADPAGRPTPTLAATPSRLAAAGARRAVPAPLVPPETAGTAAFTLPSATAVPSAGASPALPPPAPAPLAPPQRPPVPLGVPSPGSRPAPDRTPVIWPDWLASRVSDNPDARPHDRWSSERASFARTGWTSRRIAAPPAPPATPPPSPARPSALSRNLAGIAAAVTIGLVGLVAIAAAQAPGRLDGSVLAATGRPEATTQPSVTPAASVRPAPSVPPSASPR